MYTDKHTAVVQHVQLISNNSTHAWDFKYLLNITASCISITSHVPSSKLWSWVNDCYLMVSSEYFKGILKAVCPYESITHIQAQVCPSKIFHLDTSIYQLLRTCRNCTLPPYVVHVLSTEIPPSTVEFYSLNISCVQLFCLVPISFVLFVVL